MLGAGARAVFSNAERVKRDQQRCIVGLVHEATELRARVAALEKESAALAGYCDTYRAEARNVARRTAVAHGALRDDIRSLEAKLQAVVSGATPCRCEVWTALDPRAFDHRCCTPRQVDCAVSMVRQLRYEKRIVEADELAHCFSERGLLIGDGTKQTRWQLRGGGCGTAKRALRPPLQTAGRV